VKKSEKGSVATHADFSEPRGLPFVGRAELCAKIRGKLAAGGSVCLCGMQQVGKTRVAKQVMKELSELKDTACAYVSLSDLASGVESQVEQLCYLVLCEFMSNAKMATACQKAHIELMPPKIVPPVFRKILQQIHDCLGLKIVLFIDEVTKYRTWGDEAAADLLNMLETLVENGHEMGVSICAVSQLSMEMIRLRTPANHGGLHTRLSSNEFFVPPFSREDIDDLCALSSMSESSTRDMLYDKTRGYAYLLLPLIASFDKQVEANGGKIMGSASDGVLSEVLKSERDVLSEKVGEICTIYREHGFAPEALGTLPSSLRGDYTEMGLICKDGFSFAGWHVASPALTPLIASSEPQGKMTAVLDVGLGILSVNGIPVDRINSKELSILCMVASGKSPIDCLDQLMKLREWYDAKKDKSTIVPQWMAQFDDRVTEGHKKFSEIGQVTDDITKVLSPLRKKHPCFAQIFPPHEIKRAVPLESIVLTNTDVVVGELRSILGLPEPVRKKNAKK